MTGRALENLKAVASAVRVEIEFAELYAALANRARNPVAKKLLRAMASDEEIHRIELMDLYEGMAEGQEASIPPSRPKRDKNLGTEADTMRVFEGAYAKELDAERSYRQAAERVIDYKMRILFLTLAETQRGHADSLRQVMTRLKRDPHWLDRRDPGSIHGGPGRVG